MKNKYAFGLKSIKKNLKFANSLNKLNNKTFIISSGRTGVGYNIAKKLALNGANVTILGKIKEVNPKMNGTIYSAAENICDLVKGPKCMGIPCNLRSIKEVEFAINETVDVYGTVDGVVLNDTNINGTYLLGQMYLKYVNKNKMNGKMLIISPPLDMLYENEWWINHLYDSMSKFNVTIMAKFWNKEFTSVGINTLWPRRTINTAPVKKLLGGEQMINISRRADIMGDAAKHILSSNIVECTGKNFIDDEVLASIDIDVEKYRVNTDVKKI